MMRTFRIQSCLLLLAGLLSCAATYGQTLDCLIEPFTVVDVSSPVEGVLEELAVERSESVTEGQILATLEASVEKSNVELARARADTDGEISAAQTSLNYAQRKLNRINELYNKQATASNQKDEAETEVRLAKLSLQQAKEKKRLAELELQRALDALELRTLRSPINGVVVKILKSPGESVKDRPILNLAQINPLKVEVIVPAKQFGRIKPGQLATIMPDNMPKKRYQAKVTIVDRVIDAASGTFGVRLELPNDKYKIPSGLSCRIIFLNKLAPSKPSKQPHADSPVSIPQPNTAVAANINIQNGTCARLGPFRNMKAVEEQTRQLTAYTSRIDVIRDPNSKVRGYLLLAIPPDPEMRASKLMASLRKEKVKDIALITRGDNRGRVSLGLFRKEANAKAQSNSLKKRGIANEIQVSYSAKSALWMDITLEQGVTIGDIEELIGKLPINDEHQTDCAQSLNNTSN